MEEEVRWNGHRPTKRTEAATERERAPASCSFWSHAGQVDLKGGCIGKLLIPSRYRACVDLVRCQFKVSERRVCRVLGQHQSTQRWLPPERADEERLVEDMIELTRQYGRCGYCRIAALLRDAGWQVNDKRVERLWRREGPKVSMSQLKKGRLWLIDGSCV